MSTQRWFSVLIIFTLAFLLNLAIWQNVYSAAGKPPQPQIVSTNAITTTTYLPLIASTRKLNCSPATTDLMLQSADIPSNYILDFDDSGPVSMADEGYAFDAISGCTVVYKGGVFSPIPIIVNSMILFEDAGVANDYFNFRRNILTDIVTNTERINISPPIGDEQFGLKLITGLFSLYDVSFRYGGVVGSVTVVGWTGLPLFADTIKYARIVAGKVAANSRFTPRDQ